MFDFNIDFTKTFGAFSKVNGVVNGPKHEALPWFDQTEFFKKAGFPFVRMHDTYYPNASEVDVSAIFPDFSKDPEDAESYDFAKTDVYLRDIAKTGAEIFYRLGETIEHHSVKKHTFAPTDPKKWAKIALGIMKHYNEGWADGFHYNIRTWEIWEEPDAKGVLWQGTPEQYYELYAETSKLLKAHAPDILIGGYAACAGTEYFKNFLAYIKNAGAPLDFFSYDIYTDNPQDFASRTYTFRAILDEYGYTDTTIRISEWNAFGFEGNGGLFNGGYERMQKCYDNRRNEKGASFCAASMILMQSLPLETAAIYCADTSNIFSMFSCVGAPGKSYYAYVAANDLFKLEKAQALYGLDQVYCAAGTSDKTNVALVANLYGENREYSFDIKLPEGKYVLNAYVIDDKRTLELVESKPFDGGAYTRYVPGFSTLELKINKI